MGGTLVVDDVAVFHKVVLAVIEEDEFTVEFPMVVYMLRSTHSCVSCRWAARWLWTTLLSSTRLRSP